MRTIRLILVVAGALGSSLAALAAEPKDLEATPQGKAYRASIKAIETGDEKAYAKAISSEAGREMAKAAKDMGKTPKGMLELVKVLQPKDVKLSGLQVDGKKATLAATGRSASDEMFGTIELVKENGKWRVRTQSWSDEKK